MLGYILVAVLLGMALSIPLGFQRQILEDAEKLALIENVGLPVLSYQNNISPPLLANLLILMFIAALLCIPSIATHDKLTAT